MNLKDYLAWLDSYIWQLFWSQGGKLEFEGATYELTDDDPDQALNNQKDIRFLIQNLQDKTRVTGVTPQAPFYDLVMGYVQQSPQWQAEQGELARQQEGDVWARQFKEREFETGQKWQDWQARYKMWQDQATQAQTFRKQSLEMGLAGQQWQRQQWMATENLKAQQAGMMAERFGALTRGGGEPQQDWRAQSQSFEKMRNIFLNELQGPEDWIERWKVKNKPNRWKAPSTTPEDDVIRAQEEIKKWEGVKKTTDQMIKEAARDPEKSLGVADMRFIKSVETALDTSRRKLFEFEAEEEYAESRQWAGPRQTAEPGISELGYGGDIRAPVFTTPETPKWLRNIYPELGERLPEREGITPVAALSGQTWGRLDPSQQAGWMGYAKYTGAIPADLMAQTQKMLPRQPQIPTRWQPARQRA